MNTWITLFTFLHFLKCHFKKVKSRFLDFEKNAKNVFSNYGSVSKVGV